MLTAGPWQRSAMVDGYENERGKYRRQYSPGNFAADESSMSRHEEMWLLRLIISLIVWRSDQLLNSGE